jgi:hypothetical protein
MWESLIRRLEGQWADTRSYMVYEYLNQLTVRDTLDEFANAMPAALQYKFRETVTDLDHRYVAATAEDGGAELANYWKPLTDGRETRWWWTRKPLALPPGW